VKGVTIIMRKVFLLVLMVFITLGFSVSAWAGTIFITTAAELNNVRLNLAGDYKLGNDIDLTGYLAPAGDGFAMWNTAGWEPIGNSITPFIGSFNGGGYVIKGLWINRGTANDVGLFGYTENAMVTNLGVAIDNSKGGVKGHYYVGGLAGEQRTTMGIGINSITNCYVKGNVSGNSFVGGIVGSHGDYSVDKCSIVNCYATGSVTAGNDYAGGLVGYQFASSGSSIIENCYATGNVTAGNDYAGGLVGYQFYTAGGNSSIVNCYATGNATAGNDYAGGLVGYQYTDSFDGSSIENCYAMGNVTAGNNFAGGLVGQRTISGTNSIADSYRYAGVVVKVGGVAVAMTDDPTDIHGGIVTAAQLMTQSTYTGNGWLFNPASQWRWDARGFPKLGFGDEEFPFGAFATPLTPGGSGGGGSGGCNAFGGFGILALVAFVPLRGALDAFRRKGWSRKIK
jgi:hypothetical protein